MATRNYDSEDGSCAVETEEKHSTFFLLRTKSSLKLMYMKLELQKKKRMEL